MSTYDYTASIMKTLPEEDLLIVREFISRLLRKKEIKAEVYNPYKPLTREEVIEQLRIAESHADAGMVMEAQEASYNIRGKYGL